MVTNLVNETFARFVNKGKKSENAPFCVKNKISGKLFHASLEEVKRMEALNKLANNRLDLLFWRLAEGKNPKYKKRNSRAVDCVFRLDWYIFSLFLNCSESSKGH